MANVELALTTGGARLSTHSVGRAHVCVAKHGVGIGTRRVRRIHTSAVPLRHCGLAARFPDGGQAEARIGLLSDQHTLCHVDILPTCCDWVCTNAARALRIGSALRPTRLRSVGEAACSEARKAGFAIGTVPTPRRGCRRDPTASVALAA